MAKALSAEELQQRINEIFGEDHYVVKSVFNDGKYRKCKLYCLVCKEEHERRVSHVLAGHKCKKCGSLDGNYYTIPIEEKQKILNERISNNPLIISYPIYENNSIEQQDKSKKYSLHCIVCDATWSESWSAISRYKMCPHCFHKTRSIAYQNPELVRYFIDKNEAYLLAAQSNKKVQLKCPICGLEKEMIVGNLYRRGFSCDICGTGKSFPERFMTSVLIGNKIKYEPQYSPEWADGRKYDFYLPEHNVIVETHGPQHYQDVAFFKDAKEQKKIDELKEKEAKLHGYKYYIINCSSSDMNYIENSLYATGLISYLNLTITDEQRQRAYVDDTKAYCWELYNEGKDIHYIAKIVHHDIRAVREYLKVGAKLGLCTYQKYRKIAQVNSITGEIEKIFDMIKSASNYLNVPRTTIARWCNQGGKILYKDKYKIIWLDDYNKHFM